MATAADIACIRHNGPCEHKDALYGEERCTYNYVYISETRKVQKMSLERQIYFFKLEKIQGQRQHEPAETTVPYNCTAKSRIVPIRRNTDAIFLKSASSNSWFLTAKQPLK